MFVPWRVGSAMSCPPKIPPVPEESTSHGYTIAVQHCHGDGQVAVDLLLAAVSMYGLFTYIWDHLGSLRGTNDCKLHHALSVWIVWL